jgi:hypothetical protein
MDTKGEGWSQPVDARSARRMRGAARVARGQFAAFCFVAIFNQLKRAPHLRNSGGHRVRRATLNHRNEPGLDGFMTNWDDSRARS